MKMNREFLNLDISGLSLGIYFYRIEGKQQTVIKKIAVENTGAGNNDQENV
jgi:hypothetical protein